MQTYRYAVLGLGNVGTALVRHAAARAERVAERYGLELRLVAAVDSTGAVADPGGLDPTALAAMKESGRALADHAGARPIPSPDDFASLGAHCLVECLPTNLETGEPGVAWARAALDAGSDVVFADKGPLVAALPELERRAADRGRRIGTSGTTGGALPSLTVARRELAGARLTEIHAILNGTSNFILTRMREDGAAFGDALAEAQRMGIAEPDPSYDTAGWDTAVKLTILARGLLDESASLDRVDRHGIDELDPRLVEEAKATGGRLRLVGRATLRDDGRAALSVAPEVVPASDPFFLVDGKRKGVRFVTDDFSELVMLGGASGRTDVAASLLKDMIWCALEGRR